MVTLLQQIRIELYEEAGVDATEKVMPTTHFVDDLGLDSLDLVAFFMAIEWEFSQRRRQPLRIWFLYTLDIEISLGEGQPLKIQADEEGNISTVRDLMDWLSCHSSLVLHPQLLLGRVRWYLKRRRYIRHA